MWTFRLREGVTFQDGTPLDAPAARASFERLLTLGSRTLDGPWAVHRGPGPDHALQIGARSSSIWADRNRSFEAALASAYGTAIVNVGRVAGRTRSTAIGAMPGRRPAARGWAPGPYRIVEFDVETGAVLERNAGYWRGWEGEHFDQVILRVVVEPETRRALIENGEADIATTLPLATVRELEQNPDLAVDHRYNLAVRYIAMTVAGPLQSPEARQALCWAFPYDEVIAGVYEGFAKRAIGPVAELCRGFNPDTFVYQTDLERARALLARAGIAEGTVLTMLLPPGNTETAAMAELFQANLAAIGVGARHPAGRLRHLRRHLHRRPAGGGTSESAPVLLVTRLQRRLEPPLAAGLV